MIDRGEFVRVFVLEAICDDYENVDQVILPYVSKHGAKLGMTIERSEIVEALAGLIEAGQARAYRLSGTEPYARQLQGMPPIDEVELNFETYFYITEEGKASYLSDASHFPFDDEGPR